MKNEILRMDLCFIPTEVRSNCGAAFLTPISSESFNASSLNSLLYFVIFNTFLSVFIISDFWVFVDSIYIIPFQSEVQQAARE